MMTMPTEYRKKDPNNYFLWKKRKKKQSEINPNISSHKFYQIVKSDNYVQLFRKILPRELVYGLKTQRFSVEMSLLNPFTLNLDPRSFPNRLKQ